MKPWLRKTLITLAALAAALLSFVYFPIRENLSDIAVPAGTYDVEILRDTFGVPHVFGKTDADTAFGLAYAHAEDDFLTIQQGTLAARGQLASVYGIDAAPNDYMVGALHIWAFVDAQYESDISPEMRALLDGYAAGLNQYASEHSDEALRGLFPVHGIDIAAAFVHKQPLFFGLDGTLGDLFGEERPEDVSARFDHTSFLFPDPVAAHGSNAIAVGPARSANGETFLAVNSHQPWEGPVTWYEAHVHSEEGWDATGGLFPGTPSILNGHNRNLGWSFTVNDPDVVDVYVLEINPDDPDQYLFDGEWLDLEIKQHPITVKIWGNLSWTVKREVAWSVYGPTIRRPHGVYALRYATLGDIRLVEQFFKLNKAQNFEEWYGVMAEGPLPMFNAGYADNEGNIFYIYNGGIPKRNDLYDWSLYLPGNTSETLWTDYVPFEELPQVLNPPSGFIQNSNSSPWLTTTGEGNPLEADFPSWMGIEDPQTNRAVRSMALFGGDESITAEEFYAYKFDNGYDKASDVAWIRDTIAAVSWSTDQLTQAAAHLAKWDLHTNPDNRHTALGLVTLYKMNELKGNFEGAKLGASHLTDSVLPTWLVLDGFEAAVEHLNSHFGQIDPEWGEVNRIRRGDLDIPVGGGPDVLTALYGGFDDDGRIRGANGDSHLMIVQWDADGKMTSHSIHQFGSATLDEDSPHYADQSPLFARRELKPVWMDEAAIRANLERAYRPGD
ncbi:MAG: acylase [Anaerolineae bacterium]